MCKVFTAQLTVTRGRNTTINTTPAQKYGKLVLPCLTENVDIEHDAVYISKCLEVYFSDSTKDDYIILCGEIAIFSLAIAHLLNKNGGINILKWNHKTNSYNSTYVSL